jgi:prepilin-type N-terminal cleavage/methylation domain-containing protein
MLPSLCSPIPAVRPSRPVGVCRRVVFPVARSAGFTLLELLMVIAVVAILTAVMLPWGETGSHETMVAAAQTVATDLAYARSLAITNNSNYTMTFDVAQNRYVLEHSGTSDTLDTLPDSIFRNPDDPSTQHIVSLDKLPGIGEPVKLAGVYHMGGTIEPTTSIEFGPLGETTNSGYSIVRLTLGSGSGKRHALVLVNPVTGLATVHPYSENLPSDLSSEAVDDLPETP